MEYGQSLTATASFACNYCKKSFPSLSRLKRHNFSHNQDKPHICRICNKGCTTASNLAVHAIIHSGEKPFRCVFKTCNKSFNQSSNLNQHILTIHQITTNKHTLLEFGIRELQLIKFTSLMLNALARI